MAVPYQAITKLMALQAAATTSTQETNFVTLPSAARGADFFLDVTSLTGSGATIDITIQKGYRPPAVADTVVGKDTSSTTLSWINAYSFAQVTTSTSSGLNAQTAGPIGDLFRVSWVVAGTTPSATFTVTGRFYI